MVAADTKNKKQKTKNKKQKTKKRVFISPQQITYPAAAAGHRR
jgi:hypothetical protein